MAALFGELAYNVVHNIDGTPEQKAALHALVGGIMGELTGSGFLAGASGAAVNKLLSDELKKIAGGDPALHQWLSAALGAVVSDVVAGNAQAGSSTAASGTKNNDELEAELAAQGGKTSQELIVAQDREYIDALEKSKVDKNVQVVQNSDGTISFKPGETTTLSSVFNQSSVVINTAIAISDSVLSTGTGIKSPTGKFNVVIAVYDDSKTYSGVDFGIAVVSDIAGYTAGNIFGGTYGGYVASKADKNNPVLIIYGTHVGIQATGGVLGDTASNALKDILATPDIEKINRLNGGSLNP